MWSVQVKIKKKWSEGDERHDKGEKGERGCLKGRMRREEGVGEERKEMEMKAPGVEIRGERWDVRHQRKRWRILCSTLKTTQHTDEQNSW